VLPKAIEHLKDADRYISHAEDYLTKFIWGKLQIVIMPKGFPYHGIGHANLIYLSHNVLDDKDHLFYNILHEIIQSWIGNLITHSCWRHTALIKGLSTYIERKIIHEVEDKESSEIHKNSGEIELYDLIEIIGEDDHKTSMYPDIKTLSPNEYLSKIAHEKGFSFFSFLDQGVGRHVLKDNIRLLIENFKNNPINYVDFASHYIDDIRKKFKFRHHGFLGQIDWDLWINKKGYPVIDLYYCNLSYIYYLLNILIIFSIK
jgi:leukotriene-A4 hydrolase